MTFRRSVPGIAVGILAETLGVMSPPQKGEGQSSGLGVSDTDLVMHRYGTERASAKPVELGRRVLLRQRNDRHIVTIRYSAYGKTWTLFGTRMEVSGYHHNVAYDFLSLRPALHSAGSGEVRFRQFKDRALP